MEGVEHKVVCKPSAFKHGVTLEQILYVLEDPRYEGPVEMYENKYIVLGFDNAGNLLEIMEPVAKVGYFCNRLLQFLRLKPYETCIFKRLLLQN
jgi:hypothetical protein